MKPFLFIASLFLYSITVYSSTIVAECDTLQPDIVFESNDFSITINVEPNLLVDQYKFRYKEVGAVSWDGVVVIGTIDGQPQATSSKLVANLLSCNEYQFQKRITATDGCDSGWQEAGTAFTATTNLINISGCDSVQITTNGPFYHQSGFYTETTTSSNGCDSIILADVIINSTYNADPLIVNGCDLYTWNGTIYDQSGVYQQTLSTSEGCDSILTLDLTLNGSEIGTDTQVHCDSYQWDNGVTYTSSISGELNFLQNSYGCDSLVELDLTIYNSSNTIFNESVCNANSFTWNDSVFTQSGEYVYNYTSTNGCDSSITLNLSLVNYPELDLSSNNYSITVTVDPDSFVDQYKFRYRQLGSFSWIGVGVIGTVNGAGQSDSSKTFTNGILGCTTYEVQSRVYSNDDCDSGWNPQIQTVTTSSVSLESLTVCDSVQTVANSPYYSVSGTYEESFVSSNGCDSIIIYNITVLQSSVGDTLEITACDNYNWNGVDYSTSGFFVDTLTNAQLCDSIVFLQLEILNSSFYVDSQQHCDSYQWQDGNVYTESINTASFVSQNSVGCDSVVTLDLSILNSSSSLESIFICEPSYFWNDSLYTENGSYQFTTVNSVGCDSVATLNLLLSTVSSVTESVDTCNSYSLNGTNYTTSGLYSFTSNNAAGCDSISYLDLSLGFSNEVNQTVYSCGIYAIQYPLVSGEFIEFNISESTSFSYTVLNSQMCDSTINLDVIISDTTFQTSFQIEQCNSFSWNNEVYSESGIYSFETISSGGCDSISTLNLTITNTSNTDIIACNSYDWNGTTYTETGVYSFSIITNDGCDSTATLNLTINNSTTSETDITTCNSYNWNGITYTESGVYTFSTINSTDCDSTATLNLTIINSSTSSIDITSCDSFDWNGETYSASGQYTFETLGSNGCDSVANLNLTINNSTSSSTDVTACDSYEWNGTMYAQSGTYTFSTTNSVDCDSTATLNLTINSVDDLTDTINDVCDFYIIPESPSTILVSENNGTPNNTYVYQYLIDEETGCQYNYNYVVYVNNSSQSSAFITSCGSYDWNGVNYTESGIYTFSTINSFGCDSTATLNLTINNSTFSSSEITACDSFDWNGETYSASGQYTFETLGSNGCDSIATLNLTILNSTSSSHEIIACDSYEWNEETYFVSGEYIFETLGSNGCDSVATLNLTLSFNEEIDTILTSCTDQIIFNGIVFNVGATDGSFTITDETINCSTTYNYSLIFNDSSESLTDIIACDSYDWNGVTYTESGVYTFASTNLVGCDSIATLNLTINNSNSPTTDIISCDSYEWNGVTYTESGIYTFTSTNLVGCDSIATLNLTINNSYNINIDYIYSCGQGYTIGNENLVLYESTFIDSTFITSNGCDSLVNYNYIVLDYNQTIDITSCNSYVWNGQTYTETGSYFFNTVNDFDCDSTATLNLTINNSTSSLTDTSSCDSYDWNGEAYSTSGEYTFETLGSNGCDSIAFLNLTIVELETLNINGLEQVIMGSNSSYSVANSSNSTYDWQLNSLGTINSGQGNNSVNISWNQEGIVSLCVTQTDENGCEGQQSCMDVSISDVNSIDESSSLLNAIVYPNPFNQELYIEFFNLAKGKRQIMLFDLQGRLVYSSESTSNKVTIKREQLQSGSYLLKVISEKGILNKSVILD